VRVQAFGPELAVEGLDEAVVGRLAWPREVEHDALLVGPEIEVAADELRALVDADAPGVAHAAADPLKRHNDVLAAITEARIDGRREPGEEVDHGQEFDLAARRELVVDKAIAQVSFVCVAGRRSSRSFALTRRLGTLLRNCRPNCL